MTREAFKKYVDETIESMILEAERYSGCTLPRRYCFGFIKPSRVHTEQEQVSEFIAREVFIDEEHIYPCFDLILGDILDDGRLLFVGYRAGFKPRPWGKNYEGKDGPLIWMYGQEFLDKIGAKKDDPVANKSPEPTAVGAVSSAVAVPVASRRWFSFFR